MSLIFIEGFEYISDIKEFKKSLKKERKKDEFWMNKKNIKKMEQGPFFVTIQPGTTMDIIAPDIKIEVNNFGDKSLKIIIPKKT